ncbi:integrase [Duganella sp. HSC-15S17]|nr:integrase [Duganella violaceicalia]
MNPESRKVKGLGKEKSRAFAEARSANAALAAKKPSSLVDWVLGKTDYKLVEWLPLYKDLWLSQSKLPPADNTLRSCTMYLKRITEAPFAWMRISEVTTAHLAPYLIEIEQSVGAATAMNLRARLSDVFRMAETQGLIEQGRNPVTATYTPSRVVKRERLSLEQFLLIRDLGPIWLRRAMNLALLSGQRRDDIAEMKTADKRDGFLHVIQGKGQGRVRLALDLSIRIDALGISLDDAVKDCRDNILSRYLVHHTRHVAKAKPGDRINSNSLSNAFTAARVAAGIVPEEGRSAPTFHEIRSLAERLYREQYGKDFAQAILGHKSASMTERYDDLRGQGWQKVSAK